MGGDVSVLQGLSGGKKCLCIFSPNFAPVPGRLLPPPLKVNSIDPNCLGPALVQILK